MNKPLHNRSHWQRPAIPLQPGHNTGPRKLPEPQPTPGRLRRYGKACRPVIGYVACVVVGALIAIAAGVAMFVLVVADR